MTSVVTRLYASPDKAKTAADELKKHRFNDSDVYVVGPAAAGATADDVTASIVQAGVAKSEAGAYTDGVSKGGAVVVVHAPFGSGQRATTLLDRYEPVRVATPAAAKMPTWAPRTSKATYDQAAPLSSTFNWSLTSDDPAPLSTKFNWPTLSDFSLSRKLGFKELSSEPAPLSKAIGWSQLIDDPAPLSSKFNWSVLRDDPAPLSTKFNWPTLKD